MSDRSMELACASLTLLESLVLELRDKNILSEEEISGVFEDARNAHRHSRDRDHADFHANVAKVIDRLLESGGATNICSDLERLERERKK